jgi:hypothetical protein
VSSAGGPRQSPNRPTLTAEQFSLSGPSDDPDPRTHAYRQDLADVTLAGRVIASHYAAPVDRHLATAASLVASPADDADVVAELAAGDAFAMLDDSLGWAWGYGGDDRLVGYVRSDALSR